MYLKCYSISPHRNPGFRQCQQYFLFDRYLIREGRCSTRKETLLSRSSESINKRSQSEECKAVKEPPNKFGTCHLWKQCKLRSKQTKHRGKIVCLYLRKTTRNSSLFVYTFYNSVIINIWCFLFVPLTTSSVPGSAKLLVEGRIGGTICLFLICLHSAHSLRIHRATEQSFR